MKTIVEFEGTVESILEYLVKQKYYSNRSEAIRAGILELGQRWNVLPKADEVELVVRKMQRIDEDIQKGKRRVHSLESVAKDARVKL